MQKGLIVTETIEQILRQYVETHVNLFHLTEPNFPLLPKTFSLWRRVAYKQCLKHHKKEATDARMFELCEKIYLPIFVNKLRREAFFDELPQKALEIKAWEKVAEKDQPTEDALVQLSRSLFAYELEKQLVLDMASLPYTEAGSSMPTLQPTWYLNFDPQKKTIPQKVLKTLKQPIVKSTLKSLSFIPDFACSALSVLGFPTDLMMVGKAAVSYGIGTIQDRILAHEFKGNLEELKQQVETKKAEMQRIRMRCLDFMVEVIEQSNPMLRQRKVIVLKEQLEALIKPDEEEVMHIREGDSTSEADGTILE